ncbi:Filamentous hemagglutinin [Variovorax sp. PBS-H4]|uniref:two-partner secretion domain-containing protein n=1 Tax=Variovorax sp. PBS-H4 TaxID=434008 RepID=UPI001317C5C8|nr:filamentous hemagglutinin N-terminal domain-containing protein [Variovorax sp. PBS-H4]VTU18932.1 Filamentous hemagglutinin [Variovorax sp. PBS-H4]
MNKKLFRVVFNAARRARMVVQETARSAGKANGITPAQVGTALASLLVATAAQAQIVGAPTVAPGLRPTVLVAPNGVPLVNIQTPSAAGVSRNLYNRFDVQPRGVILNNSRTDAQTQLGGWVQGNPFLATGPARIILNEIVSGNPTQLRGALEVAGQRAEVIVANPAGIAVDGGTFINAGRATLTTGTPQLNALGGLDGYVVRGGTVSIDGAGWDARSTDYAAVLARAIQVNAALWANELKVVAGANEVSADQGQVSPVVGAGKAPAFALDVAQLGGMYAGKIFLMGTEAGVGARNAGTIMAADGSGPLSGPGEFVITAAGRLENIGTIQAARRAGITAESLANSGRIASGGELRIATAGKLGNAGGTIEAQSLQLASGGDIDNRGGMMRQTSGVGLAIQAPVLSNTGGGVIGAEPVPDVSAPPGAGTGSGGTGAGPGSDTGAGTGTGTVTDRSSSATPSPGSVPAPGHLTAVGNVLNGGGRIYAGGAIRLDTPQVNNNGGAITTASLAARGPSFSNAGGTLDVAGDFSASVGRFDNTGGTVRAGSLQIASTGDLVNRDGQLQSNEGVAVDAQALDNNHGSIQSSTADSRITVARQLLNADGAIGAAKDLAIQAERLNNSGVVRAGNDATLNVSAALANDGSITAARRITITAGSLQGGSTSVLGAGIQADGKRGTAGDLRVSTTGALGANGTNLAAGDAVLQGASIDLSSSTTSAANVALIAAHGNVISSGAAITTPGTLNVTAHNQASQTLTNQGGKLNAGQLTLSVSNLANTRGGEIVQTGKGATTIATSGALDNTNSRIATNGQDLMLDATAGITNTGGTIEHAGSGTLTIAGNSYSGANGEIVSNGALAVNVAGHFSQDGGSTSARQISIDAGTLNNEGGKLVQGGSADMRLTVVGALNNNVGVIAGNGHTAIAASSLSNQGGAIRAAETSRLGLAIAGTLDNSHQGEIGAGGTASVSAGSLNNDAGYITAVGDLGVVVTGAASNHSGTLAANGNTTVNAASLNNNGGTVAAVNGALELTTTGLTTNVGGRLQAGSAITLRNTGFDNSSGKVFGDSLSIGTGGQALGNVQGTLAAIATVNLQSGALNNNAGLIQSGAAMVINTHGQALTNTDAAGYANGQGGIASGGTLTLYSGTLDNTAGFIGAKAALVARTGTVINAAGGLILGQDKVSIDTQGAGYDNRGGQTQATGDLRIDAGAIDNTGALIRSQGTITFNAGSVTNAATLGPGQGIEGRNVSIATGALINKTGAIRADADATLTSSGGIDNTAGLVSAGNTLRIVDPNAANPAAKTLGLVNTRGKLVANKDLRIDAATFSADGVVASGQDLGIALTQDIVNSAELAANGNLSYTTTGDFINRGKLLAGQTLTVAGNNVDNTAGAEMSGVDTIVSAAGTLTNRGLIDSQGKTQISASSVDNIGTGRIYGDAISIGAGTLINDAETINGVNHSASIAARSALDIGAGTVDNRDRSLIFSAGDLFIGGALDMNRYATGQGATLDNLSADIESLGNMALSMAQVNNHDIHLQIGQQATHATTSRLATMDGKFWDRGDTWGDDASRYVFHRNPDGTVAVVGQGWGIWDESIDTTRDLATHTDPARLVAGGNLEVNGFLHNRDSHVLAGGTLGAAGVNNEATTGTQSTTVTTLVTGYMANKPGTGPNNFNVLGPVTSNSTIDIGALRYEANTNATSRKAPELTGSSANVDAPADAAGGVSGPARAGAIVEVSANVGAVVKTSGSGPGATASTPTGSDPIASGRPGNPGAGATMPVVVRTSAPNASVPIASLFNTRPDPGNRYLVETDARFANYRSWLGSDSLLDRLGLNPDLVQKRLGDGFYEQRLIREQIAQLTGSRYLDGFDSDEEQYAALMSAGATFAQQYGLRPGIALTPAQMAQLTSDIVWLVEQTATLPDGSTQRVLVPQVYVRVRPGDIDGSGALLSADALRIKSAGDVTNTGTIAGRTLVAINAETLDNLGGRISGGSVALDARADLNDIGGTIDARDSLSIRAGRDINIRTTTTTNQAGLNSTTRIDRVAGLYVTNPGGTLVASAGRDVNLVGAIVSNQGPGGTTSINAKNDIHLQTVREASTLVGRGIGNNSAMVASSSRELGTTIATDGATFLTAGRDINARQATVEAGTALLSVNAGRDIHIESGQQQDAGSFSMQWSDKGLVSRTATTASGQHDSSTRVGSRFSGGLVALGAGNDIGIEGSQLSGTQGVMVDAGRMLDIVEGRNTRNARVDFDRKRSSPIHDPVFMQNRASGTGIDVGSDTAAASTITSSQGGVLLRGGAVNLQGVQVSAARDIAIEGGSVNIAGAIERSEVHGEQRQRGGDFGPLGLHDLGHGLGAKSGDTLDAETTRLARTTLSGVNVSLTATGPDGKGGDLHIAGTTIDTPGTLSLNAGTLSLDTQSTVATLETGSQRKDFSWQQQRSRGTSDESTHYNRFNAGTLAVNANRVQAGLGARDSLEQLARQPGMGWVGQLGNDPALSGKVDWMRLEEAHRHWDYQQQGLTPEGAAIVTLVVSYFTAGTASGLGASAGAAVGGTAGTVVGGAVTAGVTALASQASVALINHRGDIGAALNDLGSSASVKSLLTAIVTGGVLAGLDLDPTGLPTPGGGAQPFIAQLRQNLTAGAARAVIGAAINGGSIEDNLREGIKSALLDTVAAQGAHAIGDLTLAGALDDFTNKAAHAIAGCMVGAARADSASGCAAGALGAAIGELAAEGYGRRDDTVQFAALMSGLAVAVTGGDASQINLASQAGSNAAANNYLAHNPANTRQSELRAFSEQLARCQATPGCDVEGVYKHWSDVSASSQAVAKNALAEWAATGDAKSLGEFLAGAVGALGANPADLCSSGDTRCYQFIQSQNTQAFSVYRDATVFLGSLEYVNGMPRGSSVNLKNWKAPEGYEPFSLFGLPPRSRGIVDTATGEIKVVNGAGQIVDVPSGSPPTWTSAADNGTIKIVWGKGIEAQGMPWEDYLATSMPSSSRLPPNFKAFDFFDRTTGIATSAKTLDTLTAAKINNPSSVYYSIKENVDAAANFIEGSLSGAVVNSRDISVRELRIAVPAGTTSAQWEQIHSAVLYGASIGVKVTVTAVR